MIVASKSHSTSNILRARPWPIKVSVSVRDVDGLSWDNAWCLELNSGTFSVLDGTLSIDSVTEGVNDSAEHALTDGNINDRSGSLDDIAFLDFSIVTQNDDTNVVGLQVESHALDSRLELDHLTGLDLGETEDSSDTITDGNDGSEFLKIVDLVDTRDLGLENRDGISN